MSDSEEEASFASADEGDGHKARESLKGGKNQNKNEAVSKSDDGDEKGKVQAHGDGKRDAQKECDKQLQQQSKPKAQVKGDSRATQKDARNKPRPSGQPVNEPKTPTAAKAPEVKTPSEAKTPTGAKAPEVKTPSEAKTPTVATDAKTSTEVRLPSVVKTPSEAKTPTVAKTPEAKTPEAKTSPDVKLPSEAKTPLKAKTPPEVKTPSKAQISEAATHSQEKVTTDDKQKGAAKGDISVSTRNQPSGAADTPTARTTSQKGFVRDETSTPTGKSGSANILGTQHSNLPESVQKSPGGSKDKQLDATETKDVGDSSPQETSDPSGQVIPRDNRDHTPEQEEVLKKLTETSGKSSGAGWGGWGNWGSSLLSAATNSVQTFTHQVGDGITTIMETVESSLGVPDPEDMLKAQNITEPPPPLEKPPAVISQPEVDKQEEKVKPSEARSSEKSKPEISGEKEDDVDEEKEDEKKDEDEKEIAGGGGGDGWFSGWSMADLAKKVQDTGKSLASKGQTLMSEGFDAVENLAAGGIDVLESIGKKTYNTLSEHDPAFRKTREFLSPKSNKPNLSSMLKEAKEKAEYEADQARESEETRKAHFGTLFDNYQGIAHLEALEMLSNQSEKKVHSLLNALASSDLAQIKPTLISIKEAFEINEDDRDTPNEQDFSSLVNQYVSELELGTAPDKLNKVHEMVKQWVIDFDSHESHDSDNLKEIHQKSIQALAELTAKGVEQFHKAGELVLFQRDKDKDCTERARSLARLTGVLCHEVGNLASKFVEILNKMAGEGQQADEVTPLVTNVYLEATNSSTYIQDAFQLLLPVLQQAALEHSILARQS